MCDAIGVAQKFMEAWRYLLENAKISVNVIALKIFSRLDDIRLVIMPFIALGVETYYPNRCFTYTNNCFYRRIFSLKKRDRVFYTSSIFPLILVLCEKSSDIGHISPK